MKTIKVKQLNRDDFKRYGSYNTLMDPEGAENRAPVRFYPDLAPMFIGSEQVSFSNCRVSPRPFVIEASEYHNHTSEGILPMDGDVILHLGRPTGGVVPYDEIEAYFVPKGTIVTLRPGVWHMAPFAAGDTPVNTLIVLPERTYANDCVVVRAEANEKIAIEL